MEVLIIDTLTKNSTDRLIFPFQIQGTNINMKAQFHLQGEKISTNS